MTDKTTAAASTTAPKKDGRPIFGTLRDVARRTDKNGKTYATGVISATKADGTVIFETPFSAFNKAAVATILDLGNGKRVNVFGVSEQVNRQGGKFSEEVFQVWKATSMEKKAEAASADAAEAQAEDKVSEEVPF